MLGSMYQTNHHHNSLELIMPPAFDEKLVTTDEDKKQLRLVTIALAERFVTHLFGCEGPAAADDGLPPLSDFIYRVVRRTNSSITTIFVALIYLIRLKQKHPACKGTHSSPHRLLLAAIIIAYKYLYDNCYHNRSWAQVSQGLFKLEEVNKMEVELLFFLGFQLYVSKQHWTEFVEFMDGKLLRSLSQTSQQPHLRRVLWNELYPQDGLKRLHHLTLSKPVPASSIPQSIQHEAIPKFKSTSALRNATISSSSSSRAHNGLVSNPPPVPSKDAVPMMVSDSSTPSQSPSDSTPSSAATPTPDVKPPRMLLNKMSSVFSKPVDNLSTAWLDLHTTLLPSKKKSMNSLDGASKNVLSNATVRTATRRKSQKFGLPPIWNMMVSNIGENKN